MDVAEVTEPTGHSHVKIKIIVKSEATALTLQKSRMLSPYGRPEDRFCPRDGKWTVEGEWGFDARRFAGSGKVTREDR